MMTMGAWAQPDTGKTFTLNCARGYVYYNGTQLAGISDENQASEFAIIPYEEQTYLYDVTQAKFVCHTTDAPVGSTGNPALESDNDFSKAVKGLTWGETNIENYPYYLQDSHGNWLNMDGSPKVYFNTWKNFEGGNGGNTYAASIKNGNYDISDAVAMLNDYFHPSATVQYVISDASGVIYTSDALPATVGATITELPADFQRPYCTYDVTSTTIAAGTNTVHVTVTYAPPFTVSSNFETATWYYATLRGKQLRADESNKDGNGRYQTNSTNERTDVYKWAFVGNPYNLSIINKGHNGKCLYADDVPVMKDATPATDNKARWIVSPNSNSGFSIRSESGANLYLNDAGNAGNLGYWNSSASANDVGSNCVIDEIFSSDRKALKDVIDEAQALVDGAGNPGYVNNSEASTLRTAITTAQSVYDDPSGDWVGAAATLKAAIATATAPANINYTPRTDVYYTLVNSRGAMVYDPSHSTSTDNGAEYLWYYDTDGNISTALTPSDIDDQDNNNLWGFIEQDGKYYMYNVGKQQFATVGTGNYGATWIFSDTPAYITLDDGFADEIVAPKVRVRATIATTGQSYTMSISPNYVGPIITYDGANDGGVPVLFTPSSKAVDAEITAIMTAKVEDITPYRNALKELIDACALLPIGDGLNQYASNSTYTDALAAANTAYNNESTTKAELLTATQNLEDAIADLVLNLPAAGFYRIKGNTSDKYLAAGLASNNKFNMSDATDATTIFYFDGTKLTNFGSGMCNGMSASAWAWVIGANASTVEFQDGLTNGGYAIKSATCNFYDNGDNSESADRGNNVTIDANTNARYTSWYLEKVTELPITLNNAGGDYYATLFLPVDATITNADAFTIKVNEAKNAANTTQLEGGKVPANTAVLLKGTSGTATATVNTNDTFDSTTSDLSGTLVAVNADGSTDYFLGKNTENQVGFYHWSGSVLKGFRAYLPANKVSGTSAKGFTLVFDEATDINTIENGKWTIENENVYNLQGQKVNRTQKGVYIVNGKKVVMK